jgi:hypothetical protein
LTGEELFQGDTEDSGEGECERRVAEVDRVVEALGSEVEIKFGNVECVLFHTLAYRNGQLISSFSYCSCDELKYIVRDTLDTFGRGALVAACNAAEAKYEE